MLDGVVVDDAGVFNAKLQEWEDFYNYHRPHGSLGGQTPYERLRQKVGGSSVSGDRQLHICGQGGNRTPTAERQLIYSHAKRESKHYTILSTKSRRADPIRPVRSVALQVLSIRP